MGLKRCFIGGNPGFQWGDTGRCFTYVSGDRFEREAAKERARKEGGAILIQKTKIDPLLSD